ncbi:hypothetical protein [Rummeliibacillus pycnus]|uniref:hypothetical protein n=1 Tax=Rummeliibacillus pycnus TaxID=101070 RepID=UPI0037C86236
MKEEKVVRKIAQVTVIFWIMKICATTLGETAGDLLSQTLGVGYVISTLIFFGIFLVTLFAQLKANRYLPVLFWSVMATTSIAGTTLSDLIDRTFGLGYAIGSSILIAILLVIFTYWYISEKSLNINNIHNRKVEMLYWTAILFSNTLGTAFGDFLSDSSGLGYKGGAILIGSLLAVIILSYFFTKVSRVFLFWIAFVLTRPFGATFGDLLTKPHEKGGLDLGTMGSSAVLASILIIFIIYSTIKNSRTEGQLQSY